VFEDKIFIACDHAGLPLKNALIAANTKIKWQNLGTNDDTSVDYPDYAARLAEELKKSANARALGVLICGSGQGMAIKANRYKHIRAALCWSTEVAELSRAHNNANVLCMGSRLIATNLACEIFDTFIKTPFEGGRHERRVTKLSEDC
jgi:ribose 5-phosphate isomerase B